nr:hypothetical protein BaRGS_006219 [Batillaria attramentaria]
MSDLDDREDCTGHRLVMLPKYAEVLQKATLDVYTGQECLTRFPTMDSRTRRKITDKVLCGVGKRHYKSFFTDACHGDSGGPLFAVPDGRMQYVLLGVVWWGLGCDVPGEPGLYLRISHFVTWIRKVLPSS